MGYTIIRETKIVKLNNGDIIHFSLQGCNNDDEGRTRDDFRGRLYTALAWEAEMAGWEACAKTEYFDLQIGTRKKSWSDYGKHLRTMTNRAKSFEDLDIYGIIFDGIMYYPKDAEPEFIPASDGEKLNDIVYGVWYGRYSGHYKNITHTVSDLPDIIEALQAGSNNVRFYIGREAK